MDCYTVPVESEPLVVYCKVMLQVFRAPSHVFAKVLLTTVSLVLLAVMLQNSASASHISKAPAEVNKSIHKVCDGGAGTAQSTWLANSSDSKSATVQVPYGATEVVIGVYGVRNKCKSSSSTQWGQSKITQVTTPDKISIDGLNGTLYTMNYPSKAGYNLGKVKNVTLKKTGSFTESQTVKVVMYSAGYIKGGWGGACAGVSSPSGPVWNRPPKCKAESSTLYLKIEVTGAPYSLSPDIDVGGIVRPGEVVTAKYSVTKSGAAELGEHRYRVSIARYPAGVNPAYGQFGKDLLGKWAPYVCEATKGGQYYGGHAIKAKYSDCWWLWKNQLHDFGKGNLSGDKNYLIPDNAKIGERFCFTIAVNKFERNDKLETNNGDWRYSALKCAVVAKHPTLQVHGGGVRASGDCAEAGSIQTSLTRFDNKTYGSWGEFDALSQCANTNFATGKGLLNGHPNSNQASWSKLTFANTPGFGNFSHSVSTPNVSDLCADVPGVTSTALPSGANVTGIHCVEADTVLIEDDIQLQNNPGSTDKIPQVIIIANTIKIRHDVKRVDAWLITDTLHTCVKSGGGTYNKLTNATCSEQLVVNGPVVTGELHAHRTHGFDGVSDVRYAAEIFNLPASTTLWYYETSRNPDLLNTVSWKELPPRY